MEELQHVDKTVAVTGKHLGRRLGLVASLVVAALGAVGYVIVQQQAAQRAVQERAVRQEIAERAQQESAREAGTRASSGGSRPPGQRKVEQVEREFADRFLQQLLTNKESRRKKPGGGPSRSCRHRETAAGRDRIADQPQDCGSRCRAGTVARRDGASGRWRKGTSTGFSRKPIRRKGKAANWRCSTAPRHWRSFVAHPSRDGICEPWPRSSGPGRLADANSESEWEAWTEAASSAASVLRDLARYAEAEPLLRDCLRLLEARSGQNSPGVGVVIEQPGAVARGHEPQGGSRTVVSSVAGDRRAVVRT